MKFESLSQNPENIPDFIVYRELVHATPEKEMSVLANAYATTYGLNNEWRRTSKMISEPSEAYEFASYLYDLGMTVDDLKGKDILDVGSGRGTFKSVIEKNGLAKSCIAFDKERIDHATNVQGKAEALPFRDNSFDMTLAHHSVPVTQATSGKFDSIQATLREMLRVTRKGGTLNIDSIQSFRKYWPKEGNEIYQRMEEVVLQELQKLHDENPELKIKIAKIFSRTSHPDSDYDMRLEITKN